MTGLFINIRLVYKGNKYPGLVFTVHLTQDCYPSELIISFI